MKLEGWSSDARQATKDRDELRAYAAVEFAQSIYATARMNRMLTEHVADCIAREAVLLADKLLERLYPEGKQDD